jgi:hypothetical protein
VEVFGSHKRTSLFTAGKKSFVVQASVDKLIFPEHFDQSTRFGVNLYKTFFSKSLTVGKIS